MQIYWGKGEGLKGTPGLLTLTSITEASCEFDSMMMWNKRVKAQ
jgi:hypothetical protein